MRTPEPTRKTCIVDADGFVTVDGVKIGKAVRRDGEVFLECKDKNKHRSARRGTDKVEVHIRELAEVISDSGA